VFTTSAYCGRDNGAGAAYIGQGAVRMVSVALSSTRARSVQPGGRRGEGMWDGEGEWEAARGGGGARVGLTPQQCGPREREREREGNLHPRPLSGFTIPRKSFFFGLRSVFQKKEGAARCSVPWPGATGARGGGADPQNPPNRHRRLSGTRSSTFTKGDPSSQPPNGSVSFVAEWDRSTQLCNFTTTDACSYANPYQSVPWTAPPPPPLMHGDFASDKITCKTTSRISVGRTHLFPP